MKKRAIRRLVFFSLVISFIFGLSLRVPAGEGNKKGEPLIPLIQIGNPFPNLTLITPKQKTYREYLGLPEKPAFLLQEVKADMVIVEFLNKYCYHCQQQAYLMNRIYKSINRDPELKGKVKMLGVGVGNNWIQLAHFRQEKRIPFPLIPDQDFKAFEAIGYPGGTPFTLIVKREGGIFVVKDAHLGLIENSKKYVEKVRQILAGTVVTAHGAKTYQSAYKTLTPGVSEEEIKTMISTGLKAMSVIPQEITKLAIRGFNHVFMIKLEREGKLDVWFAAMDSEGKVCDICHDIHFIYIFDRQGVVRVFIPIHVTKFGNKLFEDKDVQKMREALVGKNLTGPIQYNPQTDGVTSASMTSALIFKGIKRGIKLYEALKAEGYTQ